MRGLKKRSVAGRLWRRKRIWSGDLVRFEWVRREMQFLFFLLQLVEAVVDAALHEQFLVRALFA